MKLVWTDTAKEDMELIYQFHAAFNEAFAVRLYNKIIDETTILKSYPLIAPVEFILQPENESIRALTVASGRFKVLYALHNQTVSITGIWDCRRNPEILKKRYDY